MEILQRVITAAVGENWVPLEHGKCTAHPEILTPKDRPRGVNL